MCTERVYYTNIKTYSKGKYFCIFRNSYNIINIFKYILNVFSCKHNKFRCEMQLLLYIWAAVMVRLIINHQELQICIHDCSVHMVKMSPGNIYWISLCSPTLQQEAAALDQRGCPLVKWKCNLCLDYLRVICSNKDNKHLHSGLWFVQKHISNYHP